MPRNSWSTQQERSFRAPLHTNGFHSRNGSSHNGHGSRTYEELYDEAKKRNIKGRSKMSKTELERALGGR
jgi:hypothetical protein